MRISAATLLAPLRALRAGGRRAIAALGRVPVAVLCVAGLALAVMYCAHDNIDPAPKSTYHRIIAAGDGHMHFLVTRSLVFDHDLEFDNDLAQFGDPWNQPRTVTGRKNVMQQIGPSLVWAPLLAAAHGAALVANAFGAGIETHGYTLFHQRILFASSVVFAWIAVAFGLAIARRLGVGRWAVTFAGVAVMLGTTLTYYATFMPSYAHAMDAAACAIFLGRWVMTLGDLRWRRYAELGVWLGVAVMIRLQDLGFGVVLAIELIGLAWRARDARVVLRGGLTLAIALVMFVPQLFMWQRMYGTWFTTPQGPTYIRYAHPMLLELLFSGRNGWLSSHPIAYLGVIGLGLGAWRGPRLHAHARLVCGALLATLVIQVYTNSIIYDWWCSSSFGSRRMCSSTFANVVGLAVLLALANRGLRRIPRAGRWAIALVVLGGLVDWNLGRLFPLAHHTAADRGRTPSCCGDVSPELAWLARPVYGLVGNPFELPASAYYAIRHGVPLQRWDEEVGTYALMPGSLGWLDGSYRRVTEPWSWASAGDAPFLRGGFGPPQRDAARPFRWLVDGSAEAILPLLVPEPHRVTLWVAANATAGETVDLAIACNGGAPTRVAVGPAWQQITFDTDGTVGDNSIVFTTSPRPYRGGPPAPTGAAASAPVAIAIGPAIVGLPP